MKQLPRRQTLNHVPPGWVRNESKFFITVYCAERGASQLDKPERYEAMVHAIELYVAARKWWVDIFLAMPDHWHAIISFPDNATMSAVLRDWKRFTAKKCGIMWQDGFFDHRLRSIRCLNETWNYIRQNPVKKKLVHAPEAWPYVWVAKERAAR